MTIDLVFIADNKVVARVNMTASSFGNKILDTFTDEELETIAPDPKRDDDETADETYTCTKFIERVWDACVRYGYISNDYDVMGKFLDTLKIV